MEFKIWLENDHDYNSNQDKIEHEAFEFVFNKIKEAVNVANKANIKLLAAIKQIWTSENNRGIKFILPQDKFPTLSSLRIRFNFVNDESSVTSIGNSVDTLYIGATSLQNAITSKDENLLKSSLARISGSLNHEITHLHHKGANDGDGSIGEIIKYLTNPGEIRAHAKDYSYMWASTFPGKKFDVKEFIQKVIPSMVESKQKKATNYLVAFADPAKQSKYSSFANISQAYKEMINIINGYVNWYVQKQSSQKTPAVSFQGFQMGDKRSHQERAAYLNSIGINTSDWGRAEIMRGIKNK